MDCIKINSCDVILKFILCENAFYVFEEAGNGIDRMVSIDSIVKPFYYVVNNKRFRRLAMTVVGNLLK